MTEQRDVLLQTADCAGWQDSRAVLRICTRSHHFSLHISYELIWIGRRPDLEHDVRKCKSVIDRVAHAKVIWPIDVQGLQNASQKPIWAKAE